MRHVLFVGLGVITACSGGDDGEPFVSHCDEPGVICNFSGTPEEASFGGDGILAIESGMYLPIDLTFHPDGTAYVIDWNNHRIRHIDDEGMIETISGTGFLGDGPPGDARAAAWNHPTNLAFNPANPNIMAVAAWHNSRIELIHLDTGELEFIAGTGDREYSGPGEAATALLDLPSSVTWDESGERLFIMDQANQLIRVIENGQIANVAGAVRDPGYDGDGGLAKDAVLHASTGQAADPSNRLEMYEGRLYMVDSQNSVVRMINEEGIIDTIAGLGADGYGGDGGPARAAQLAIPRDLAIGPDGEIYVADTDNNCVRVIHPDGIIDRFAGQCGADFGWEGDNGPALDAMLNRPFGIAVDLDGNVYVADTYNQVIRKITR